MQDHYNIRRIRLYASQNEISGSSGAREECISRFLYDLGTVFTPGFIDELSDDAIGHLFVDWLRVAPKAATPEELRTALSKGITLFLPFSTGLEWLNQEEEYQAEVTGPPGKVVSLHERTG